MLTISFLYYGFVSSLSANLVLLEERENFLIRLLDCPEEWRQG